MLVAAAVCPHPPALLPALTTGAAPELDTLRGACRRAVQELLGAEPELVVVVGGDRTTRAYDEGSRGSFAPYGLAVEVVLQGRPETSDATAVLEPATLPLSLTVGAWLLEGAGARCPVVGQGVAFDAAPEECLQVGGDVAAAAGRVGLLVMADGSARRSVQAPETPDAEALAHDERVVGALRSGDTAALAGLDPERARALLVDGRAAWQVLAGAWRDDDPDPELLHADAPSGVLYAVAVWTRHG